MKKILLIDRDSAALNDISRLLMAINYEPIVAFNTASIKNIIQEEIAAVFLDVEMKSVNIAEVINYFNAPQKIKNGKITPVFFMCTKPDALFMKQAKLLPHADIIIKPMKLEDVFKKLHYSLDFENFEYEQFSNQYRLEQLKKYNKMMDEWLEKFGSLLAK